MAYDISAIKRKMLVKYPFFGSVVANVKYKENVNMATAGTDGNIIYYNPKFLENLSVEEQTFILAHEVCHIAFNHILRSKGKDPKTWNIATDAVINQFLKKDGLEMVEGGIDMEEAINYDAEELYEKIMEEKSKKSKEENGKENEQQGAGEGNNQDNKNNEEKENDEVGHDTHNMWKDAVKEAENEKEDDDKNEKSEDKQIKNKQEELEKMGEKDAFEKNQKDKKENLKKLQDEIAKEVSKDRTTNSEIREINDIGIAKPIIDWRYVLKEAVKYEVDWSYRNATIENGVLTPHLEEQSILETEIVLDTSGSIDEILLKNFLRECKNILKHSKLKVGCFDTKFYGFKEIRTIEDIENMEFVGGGGTDFEVAIHAFSKRTANKIIFTDGFATMPDESIDAIWIVFGYKKIKPKGGKVIYVTPDQLEKLTYKNPKRTR